MFLLQCFCGAYPMVKTACDKCVELRAQYEDAPALVLPRSSQVVSHIPLPPVTIPPDDLFTEDREDWSPEDEEAALCGEF